jgi:hypothetical protein
MFIQRKYTAPKKTTPEHTGPELGTSANALNRHFLYTFWVMHKKSYLNLISHKYTPNFTFLVFNLTSVAIGK